MARQYFAVRGVRLCVDVTGAIGARPLVLLHALGQDRSSWEPVAPALARTQRVYAVDMRGFGDSDRPGRYSYAEMRDDVLALLDVIGADCADLIGHSMGGTVAWLVAQARPDRLAHLVVEDTPPPRRGSRRARTRRLSLPRMCRSTGRRCSPSPPSCSTRTLPGGTTFRRSRHRCCCWPAGPPVARRRSCSPRR